MKHCLPTFLISPFLVVGFAGGEVISINFEGLDDGGNGNRPNAPNLLEPTDSAGLVPATNWNNLSGPTGTADSLIDTNGDITSIEMSWVGQARWSWERASETPPATPNGSMFNGYLDTNGNNGSHTITVEGVPYSLFDVIVYIDGEHAGPGNRPMRVNINPGGTGDNPTLDVFNNDVANFAGTFVRATETVAPGTNGANYALFEGITSQDFEIFAEAETFRAGINGFQIVESQGNTDRDNDGLLNIWELSHGFDPDDDGSIDIVNGPDGDPDQDGSNNLREQEDETDPNDEDSDDDSLFDGVETGTGVFVDATDTGSNPLSSDTDNDTLLDNVETGTGIFVDATNTGTNPNDEDSDDDLLIDGWEVDNDLDPNDNGDVIASNGSTADPDGDFLDNFAEQERGTDPNDNDTDDDTLLDSVETNTGIFVDATDTGTNPVAADTDLDRILDADEIAGQIPTDPNNFDTDNDGLTDLDELALGTSPTDEDSDDDEVSDSMEVAFGSNPLSNTDQPDLTLPSIGVNFEGNDSTEEFSNFIEPDEIAGMYPISNWSNAFGNSGFLIELPDSNGDETEAEIDWTSQAVWSWERQGVPVLDSANGTLLNGYLDTSGNNGIIDLRLSFVPYPIYHIIVYVDAAHIGPGRPGSVVLEATGEEVFVADTRNWDGTFVQGFGANTATSTRGAGVIVFNDVTEPIVDLVATARTFRVGVNAIQIVQSSNPIPINTDLSITDISFDEAEPSVTLTWDAMASVEYTIQRSLDLESESWDTVGMTTPTETGEIEFTVPAEDIPEDSTRLFFRILAGAVDDV